MPDPIILKLGVPLKGKVSKTAFDAPAEGALIAARDFFPFDCKTRKARLSIRPGYASLGSLSAGAGLFTLGSAYNEAGGVQLMGATSSNLYRWTGSAWSNVGSITSSASRTIHAASFGKWLFVACNDPYKFYDYDAGDTGTPNHTIATWDASTAGTIPPNCRLTCEWNARIVLAGDPANPHVINFSRSDDPFDWDFTQEDNGTAISIPIQEAATCVIPHNRNCLIVGTKSACWIFRGNPAAANAIVEKFAFVLGPINSSAWCKSADDYTYFIAHNGLYKMAPGCGAPPEDVSRNLIPDGLLGLDGTNSKAYLVYDEAFRGVQIHVMGTNAQSWFYDVDGGGFWPISAPGTSILAAHRFGPADSATASGALVATSSNVMRFDSATALGGSDVAFATFLLPIAPLGMKSLIQRGVITFGDNTDDTTGTVEIFGGENGTKAVAMTASRKSSVAISALLANHGNWQPRVGGQSAVFKLTQGLTSKYQSFEGAALYIVPAGVERG